MTIPPATTQAAPVKVGIVGAGPAGLAAAIFLNRLPFVSVEIFDQARELREVGAGISINQNTWRLLKLLGAAEFIEQYTRRGKAETIDGEQRDGATGELLQRKYQPVNPDAPARSRIERYKLQQALLSQIPAGTIQLGKRLAGITEGSNGVTLTFQDGSSAGPFDLLVGADGLRSVVREHAFPKHRLSYTGKVAFRTLIPQEAVAHIPDLPRASTFWHLPDLHVYTDFLDNGLFEIATRANLPQEHGDKVSWGQKISKEAVVPHYQASGASSSLLLTETRRTHRNNNHQAPVVLPVLVVVESALTTQGFCETIRKVIEVPDEWLEFAMFGGPRLETVVHAGSIALLGDASHPLSGAFGSGAAFAFEDAYVLSAALAHAHANGQSVADALKVYDELRIPRYRDLHGVLDAFAANAKSIRQATPTPSSGDIVRRTVELNWSTANEWIYTYDVTKVWEAYEHQRQTQGVGKNPHTAPVPKIVDAFPNAGGIEAAPRQAQLTPA